MLSAFATSLLPQDGVIVTWLVSKLGINWKTSLNGILALLIAFFGLLTTFLSTIASLLESMHLRHAAIWSIGFAILGALITMLTGLCRAAVGLLQFDSGVTAAKLPGVDEVVGVPSHETPFSQKAKPVKDVAP